MCLCVCVCLCARVCVCVCVSVCARARGDPLTTDLHVQNTIAHGRKHASLLGKPRSKISVITPGFCSLFRSDRARSLKCSLRNLARFWLILPFVIKGTVNYNIRKLKLNKKKRSPNPSLTWVAIQIRVPCGLLHTDLFMVSHHWGCCYELCQNFWQTERTNIGNKDFKQDHDL